MFIKQTGQVKHSTMLTRSSWLKSNSWQNLQKTFIISQMLKPLRSLHFGFLYYRIPWACKVSKNKTNAARQMVIKLDLSLRAGQDFQSFLIPNLLSWRSCVVIVNFPHCCIFLTTSVLLHFSKFRSLVFDPPCLLWTKYT